MVHVKIFAVIYLSHANLSTLTVHLSQTFIHQQTQVYACGVVYGLCVSHPSYFKYYYKVCMLLFVIQHSNK